MRNALIGLPRILGKIVGPPLPRAQLKPKASVA
jgi:hypothetical protein